MEDICNKKICLFLSLGVLLVSCNNAGGNNPNILTTSNLEANLESYSNSNTNIILKSSGNGGGVRIDSVDLVSLDYLENNLKLQKSSLLKSTIPTICIADDSICASANISPATYAVGYNGGNYFMIKDTINVINIKFNKGNNSSFYLKNIYNDNLNNEISGYISQVDTKECETNNLVAGSSCKIYIAYTGSAYNSSVNNIHFIFANGSSKMDLVVPVSNRKYSSQKIPIMNTIVATDDIMWLHSGTNENSSFTGIIHPMSLNYPLAIVNVGDKSLVNENNVPYGAITIKLATVGKLGAQKLDMTSQYAWYTGCGRNDINTSNSLN